MNKKIFLLFVMILIVSGCSNNNSNKKSNLTVGDDTLTVSYIDVGNADSTLYQSNSCNILIDAGTNEEGKTVVNYLKDNNVDKIDYVFGTHPHEDHIGGLDDVINNFKISNIYLPNKIHTSKTFEDVLDSLDSNNLTYKVPKNNEILECGNLKIEILGPEENKDYGDNLNAWSIVTKITFGNTSFLSAGDMDFEEEDDILNSNKDLSADVFKINHHGSNNNTNSNELLERISPKLAIVPTGQPNSYQHPHQETINRLNNMNIKYLRTDEKGTIIVKSNGNDITTDNVKIEKTIVEENNNTNKEESLTEFLVGNKNSKIFHELNCSGLPIEKNRVEFNTYDEAVSQGYEPCKKCHPGE